MGSRLKEALKDLGIEQIVSVDDDNNREIIDFNTEVQDLINSYSGSFTTDEISIIEDLGAITVADIINDVGYPDGLVKKCKDLSRMNRNEVLEKIQIACEAAYDIPYKIVYDIGEVEKYTGVSSLWLLDEKFGERDVVKDIIDIIENNHRNITNLMVIITNNSSLKELNGSWQSRYEYLRRDIEQDNDKQRIRLAYGMYVLCKEEMRSRIQWGDKAILTLLEDCIRRSVGGYCLFNIIDWIKKNNEAACSRLEDISREIDLEDASLLFYNMKSEGQTNLYNAFSNIHGFLNKKEYMNHFDLLERYITASKKATIDNEKNQKKVYSDAIKRVNSRFDWNKYQFMDYNVNLSCEDVLYGDVFSLTVENQEKIGVLVTQSCDCIIRLIKDKDKQQYDRTSKRLSLLLFDIKTGLLNDELDSISRNIYQDGVIIEVNNGSVEYIEKNSKCQLIIIDSFIVDLTTFNKDGLSAPLDQEHIKSLIEIVKTDNWIYYYSVIKEKIDELIEIQNLISTTDKSNIKRVLEKIYRIDFNLDKNCFKIRRIGRLSPNDTSFLYDEYITHISRVGREGYDTI